MKAAKIRKFLGNFLVYNFSPTRIKPKSMISLITGRCNMRCKICNFWKSRINEMPTEKWKDIFRQARAMGFECIPFTGGEPLLRKDIFELAEYAKGLGFRISLSTNGVLINKFADKLNYFDEFNISLDSLKKHDEIRGVEGTFDKVVKNIKLLRKMGKRVLVRTVVQSDNYLELEEIVDFCKKKDVNVEFLYVRRTDVQYITPQDGSVFDMNLEKLKKILKDICEHTIVNNTYDYFDLCLRRSRGPVKSSCLRPYEGIMVHPDGKVFPCCGGLPSVGNLTKSSLKEIWNSYPKMRRMAYKCDIKQCTVCTSSNIQRGYSPKKILKKKVLPAFSIIRGMP